MPTLRKRKPRNSIGFITPEVVAAYREILELQPARIACIEGPRECDHRECDRYRELSQMLTLALHVKPWEECPWDVDDGPCPDWDNPERWHKAQALRKKLIAELKGQKV